ncbi:hypothetical protein FCV62_21325 [Vibrio kanaloae]|uniref:hypothetical protein n=1 Tax=Vibrio kanaloae TaxID=170673 RepID=UPI0010BE986F|nr:hypothetical protein [Vibrio kanaloae]TKF74551.1 hypothetical protein FCV62_21325 [Vibrio kanaloae]
MEIESISAIQSCMSSLGLKRNDQASYEVTARIKNLNKATPLGKVDVTFWSNVYSGDGPFVSVDDTIRGYGIPFEEFKPRFQTFSFDEKHKILEVKGNGYNFQLIFT